MSKQFHLWILLILLFTPFCALSQNQIKIDSLKKLLSTNISEKKLVDIYNEIASEYGSNDTLQVSYYTSKAIEAAQKIDYTIGIVDSYYQQGWVMLQTSSYNKARKLSEKSLQLAEGINYDKGVAMALRNLGILNNYQGNYSESLELYEKSLEFFMKAKEQKGIAYGYSNIGIIHKNQGNYAKAIEYYNRALKIFLEIQDKQGLGYLYNNFGVIYKNKDNYHKALEYFQQALTAFKQVKDTKGLVYVYNNLGNVYKKQAKFEQAFTYYEQSLKIKQRIGDKRGASKTLSNLGDINMSQKNYQKALSNYKASEKISIEIKDISGIGRISSKLGKFSLSQERYDDAQNYFEKTIEIKKQLGERVALARAFVNLGITFFYKNNNVQAVDYLEQGKILATQLGKPDVVIRASEYLARVYNKIGNYKEAYNYQVLYKTLSDSIFNEENVIRITRLEEQYLFEKVQDSLELVQNQEKTLLNTKIEQRNITLLVSVIALIFVLCTLTILIIFYKNKQKSNIKLREANEEIYTINNSLQVSLQTVQNQRDKIVDSINYAQNIQKAILPLEKNIEAILNDYFILYRPLDVVSGDFYWVEQINNKKFIVVADCTGHGVPGAFMTMLGMLALNDVVIQKKIYEPEKILNSLDDILRRLLKSASTHITDGMDIGVCVIDESLKEVSFAGAKTSLILIHTNNLTEIRGASRGLNALIQDNNRSFSDHTFKLQKETSIYLYSDGYQDQFGGEKNKKFMKKRFKQLLLEISEQEMLIQKQILASTLDNWMQDENQVDDILVMGVRI